MNPVSLMANAEKLSIGQLQQAVKNGTIPAYIGIPMMQEKMKQAKQAQPTQAPAEPPIAQQVMAEASGIDQMPSNLPTQSMNDGGIVAFADGGDVEDFDQEAYEDQIEEAEYAQAIEDRLNAAEQGGASRSKNISVEKPKNINRTPDVEGGIKDSFDAALQQEGVSGPLAKLARSIYMQESGGGKNTKTSNAGAVGGMQIIPATFNRMADKDWDIQNPEQNTRAGLRYIKKLNELAGGDPMLTAAGYYGGEGAIDKARRGIAISDPRNPNAPDTLQYGRQVANRSANMAEGGIARLNNGGIPRYQSAGRVSFWDAVNPREYQRDPGYRAFADNEQGNKTYDAYLAAGNEPYVKPASSTDWLPDDIYQVTPKKRTPRFLSEMYYENLPKTTGNTLVPIYPEVPLSERSKYLQHGATFGETGSGGAGIGADTYYPPSPAGSDAARFREQASGAVDAASPSATPNVPSNKGMSPEYEPSVLGGMGMSPEYEPSTNVPAGNTGNTDSSGSSSSGGSSSGSGNGSSGGKQKSEYDLIREDIMNQRAELKRQKQEDKYMAIIQAGLGMMAGTSPNAFANIGQGASSGIAQYGSSSKQRAAENAALNKGLISAQRYKSMDDYQRAALADRTAGRADIIADRQEGRADTLGDKTEARALREKQYNQQVEGQIDLGIAARQKAIEGMVQAKLSKLDPLGSLSGDQQMQKFNQMVQEELARDIKEGTLKNLYERKKYYQKQNWGIDFEMPNYGSASTAAPSGVTVRKVK